MIDSFNGKIYVLTDGFMSEIGRVMGFFYIEIVDITEGAKWSRKTV